MSTTEELNPAIVTYNAAVAAYIAQQTTLTTARAAFDAAVAAEQATVDAALAQQTINVAAAQATLDEVQNTTNDREGEYFAALQAMLAIITDYVP